MASLIGQDLGQYHITALLGKGGMAAVYRARQTSIDRDVALKVIRSDLIESEGSEEFRARFNREAQVIASLSHPHIVKVFDYGRQGDLVYLVMELLDGGNLAQLIRNKAQLPTAQIAGLLDQIASALDYAHRRAIVHRDLKPQNVLLDQEGNAFLTDFGIAKLLIETSSLTQSGIAMGTPVYMSPEQWRGQDIDSRADIYALGVMLYEMLSGKAPFTGDTPYSIMHKHFYEPLPDIRAIRPDLPEAVQLVLKKSMAKNRDRRFSSAGEVASAFRAALSGVSVDTLIDADTADSADVTSPVPLASVQGVTPIGVSAAAKTRPAMRLALLLGAVIVALLGVIGLILVLDSDQNNLSAQATATPVPAVAVPTAQPTITALAALPTDAPTATQTATATDLPTETPTHTFTLSPTATLTPSPTATDTYTPTPTATFTPSATATSTYTSTPTATFTPSATATSTYTPTPTATFTPSATATATPNLAASFTALAQAQIATVQAIILAEITATAAAVNTAQALQTRSAALRLTGTARALSSTATAIAFSQPSGRIIFHTELNGRWEINQVTLPDGSFSRLTDGRGVYYLPSFSPDGRYIALSANLSGNIEIYIMRADGSGLRRVSALGGENWGAVISPDNQRVVWHSNRPGAYRIFMADTDGSNVRQLTEPDPQGSSLDTDPSWSPDGQMIVFGSLRPPKGLFIMDVDTGKMQRLNLPGDDAGDPSWSPDGSRIAFHTRRDGNLEIYVLDLNGPDLYRLTDDPADDGRPAWSPDGQWIAFESDRGGKLDIYIMRADGSDVRRVTSNPGKNGWPSWAR